MTTVAFVIAIAALLAAVGAYHTAEDITGRRSHPGEGKTYETHHGHRMPQQEYHTCFEEAQKLCVPHKGARLAEHVAVSTLHRCIVSKKKHFSRPCMKWADTHEPCLEDIEMFCPSKTMGPTIDCVNEKWMMFSSKCRRSEWYLHQFPHDHARQSHVRQHRDDDEKFAYEEPVEEYTVPFDLDESEAEL